MKTPCVRKSPSILYILYPLAGIFTTLKTFEENPTDSTPCIMVGSRYLFFSIVYVEYLQTWNIWEKIQFCAMCTQTLNALRVRLWIVHIYRGHNNFSLCPYLYIMHICVLVFFFWGGDCGRPRLTKGGHSQSTGPRLSLAQHLETIPHTLALPLVKHELNIIMSLHLHTYASKASCKVQNFQCLPILRR